MLQIPTDNLYKFCALSGMITFAAANYILLSEASSVFDRFHEEELQAVIIKTELDHLEVDFDRFEKQLDLAESKGGENDVESSSNLGNEQRETLENLILIKRQIELRTVELEYSHKKSLYLFRRLWVVFIADIIISGFGGGLAVIGFRQWYKYLQEPQDKLVERQFQREGEPPVPTD